MPNNYLSKIQLPNGNTYLLKDEEARGLIETLDSRVTTLAGGGVTITVVSGPADTPYGVQWGGYTGELLATNENAANKIYFVPSDNATGDQFDEYMVVTKDGAKVWEKIGNTDVDLSSYLRSITYTPQTATVLGSGTEFKAASSSVTRSGGSSDVALGEATTFTNSTSNVSFGTHTTKTALGTNATFSVTQPTITVTPSTTYIKATASGTAVGANGTQSVVPSYSKSTKKLATTSIDKVTNSASVAAGSLPSFTATVGTGSQAETLILGWSAGTLPTMPAYSSQTIATGSLADTDANGGTIMTDITGATAVNCLTGVKVTTQPTISLATETSSATGRVQVATGITSATAKNGAVSVNSADEVSAITTLGSATAAAQTITVGTNDKVTAITGLGTLTAGAQAISVKTADEKTVLLSTTTVVGNH